MNGIVSTRQGRVGSGRETKPAWPWSRDGVPCRGGWAWWCARSPAAACTPSNARAERTSSRPTASSSIAPRRTCTRLPPQNVPRRARKDPREKEIQRDRGREEELREGGANPWLLRRRLRPEAAGRWSVKPRVRVDGWRMTLYWGDGRVVAVGWARVLEWLDVWASASHGPGNSLYTWAQSSRFRTSLHLVCLFPPSEKLSLLFFLQDHTVLFMLFSLLLTLIYFDWFFCLSIYCVLLELFCILLSFHI